LPRLDIVPALSGASSADLCFGAARARAFGVLRVRAETQRWLLDFALIPVAILCAVAFCAVNDFAVAASRRFGTSAVAFGEDLVARLARRREPRRAGI